MADARQLKSASMDDVDGEVDTVARDPKITTIAVDSLNGYIHKLLLQCTCTCTCIYIYIYIQIEITMIFL